MENICVWLGKGLQKHMSILTSLPLSQSWTPNFCIFNCLPQNLTKCLFLMCLNQDKLGFLESEAHLKKKF